MATDFESNQLREAIRADVAARRWLAARAKLQELAARDEGPERGQVPARVIPARPSRSTRSRPHVTVLPPRQLPDAPASTGQAKVARALWWVPGLESEQHHLQVPVVAAYLILLLVVIFAGVALKAFVLLVVLAVYLASDLWGLRRRLPAFNSSSYLIAGLAWLGLGACASLTLLLGLDAVPLRPAVAEQRPIEALGAPQPAVPAAPTTAAPPQEARSNTGTTASTGSANATPVVVAPSAPGDHSLAATPSPRPAEPSPAAGIYAARTVAWAKSIASVSDTLRTQSIQAVRTPSLLDDPKWTISITAALAQLQAAGQDMQGFSPVPPEMAGVQQTVIRLGLDATTTADEYLQATSAARARSAGGLQRLLIAANHLESLAGQCQEVADQAQSLLNS